MEVGREREIITDRVEGGKWRVKRGEINRGKGVGL